MSEQRVRDYLKKFNLDHRIQTFEKSSATVELAAKALGCKPERIAKTISLEAEEGAVLIVAAGDVKIDNKKYKNKFGRKAKMIKREELNQLVGHGAGGVCPFAVKKGVMVYLDESLKRFETVFPAAGTSNSAVELSIVELEICSGVKSWVDVCKAAVTSVL